MMSEEGPAADKEVRIVHCTCSQHVAAITLPRVGGTRLEMRVRALGCCFCQVHPMVMNVGKRPTVNTGDEEASLEIHVMHSYAGDFYGKVRCKPCAYEGRGVCIEVQPDERDLQPWSCLPHPQEMKAVVLGYIRPEMRFPGGIPELLNRIKLDIAIGRNQLADPASQDAKSSL